MEGGMTLVAILIWIAVGAVAGWLAGLVMRGAGFGLVGNMLIGIIGAVVAGFLLPRIGLVIGGGILANLVNAFIGAVIVLFVIGLMRRR
jgi:uncharacterized membrane protein YeaQ/YmgE (transglycosylase-associated protein family)